MDNQTPDLLDLDQIERIAGLIITHEWRLTMASTTLHGLVPLLQATPEFGKLCADLEHGSLSPGEEPLALAAKVTLAGQRAR